MSIQIRNITITGIFASDSTTTIPETPVAGQSYRDVNLDVSDIKYGWPYKEIVDSSKFNQYLFEISNLNKQIEIYGFLPWSNLTDYEEGACCLGTDGKIYQAVQNTGPSTTAYNPVNDTNHTYWNYSFARVTENNNWSGTNTFVTQPITDSSINVATTAYVKGCVPKNVGSEYKLVYTNSSGKITESTANIGGSGQPVYMASGTITACSFKVGTISANKVITSDANGDMVSSSITTTELDYLSGATGNVQTQLNSSLRYPDYTARVSKSANTDYTAEFDGLLYIFGTEGYNTYSVTINGVAYNYVYHAGDGYSSGELTLFVKAGDTFNVRKSGSTTVYLIPYRQ